MLWMLTMPWQFSSRLSFNYTTRHNSPISRNLSIMECCKQLLFRISLLNYSCQCRNSSQQQLTDRNAQAQIFARVQIPRISQSNVQLTSAKSTTSICTKFARYSIVFCIVNFLAPHTDDKRNFGK